MDAVELPLRRLRPERDADIPLPGYATPGAAGMDVRTNIDEPVTLAPGQRAALPTGLAMAIPAGFEVQVRARSGLAFRHGIAVLNGPGTIDSDYRGELRILLVNLGQQPYTFQRNERVAQLVLAPVTRARPRVVETLDSTARNEGGFGSTGRS